MKEDQVVEHIQKIWAANPLPAGTADLATTTVAGIKQQLATGSKSIHYLNLEDGQLWVRLIKVTE